MEEQMQVLRLRYAAATFTQDAHQWEGEDKGIWPTSMGENTGRWQIHRCSPLLNPPSRRPQLQNDRCPVRLAGSPLKPAHGDRAES